MLRTGQAIYLVERVDDLPRGPHVSSTRKSCADCGNPVWVDLDGVELARQCRVTCRPCLEDGLADMEPAR
jgi:hypothetical protein